MLDQWHTQEGPGLTTEIHPQPFIFVKGTFKVSKGRFQNKKKHVKVWSFTKLGRSGRRG